MKRTIKCAALLLALVLLCAGWCWSQRGCSTSWRMPGCWCCTAPISSPARGGILLSGPSGIGKSTQAALWQRYGAAQTVNGDRALVRPDTGTVSGVMYAGTSGICRNVTAPLRAVVLLHQAPESRVTDIRPQEAFARVLSQCAYHQWDPASAARMTELAARLVTNVPVRQLDCRADESAVRALEEALRRT